MRSYLFVPGDDQKKLEKGPSTGADALILDLEDSVALSRKAAARQMVADVLRARAGKAGPALFVRVNALDTGMTDADLDTVMPAAPFGIMLPKCHSGADVAHLGAKIAVREAESDLPDGHTRILPVATETARSLFHLGTYDGSSQRLFGLTWGAEDLAADIGAEANRLASGAYSDPFRLARSLCIMGAAAAGVLAVDTVFTNFQDEAGLVAETEQGRRDGYTGKMAIHPAQVAPINRIFTPDAATLEHARQIINAFAANPDAGVVAINGRMIDRPHLRQAERIMARAKAAGVA